MVLEYSATGGRSTAQIGRLISLSHVILLQSKLHASRRWHATLQCRPCARDDRHPDDAVGPAPPPPGGNLTKAFEPGTRMLLAFSFASNPRAVRLRPVARAARMISCAVIAAGHPRNRRPRALPAGAPREPDLTRPARDARLASLGRTERSIDRTMLRRLRPESQKGHHDG